MTRCVLSQSCNCHQNSLRVENLKMDVLTALFVKGGKVLLFLFFYGYWGPQNRPLFGWTSCFGWFSLIVGGSFTPFMDEILRHPEPLKPWELGFRVWGLRFRALGDARCPPCKMWAYKCPNWDYCHSSTPLIIPLHTPKHTPKMVAIP